VTVAVWHSVSLDGPLAQIVEFDGRVATLRFANGGYSSVVLAEFASTQRTPRPR